MRKHKTIINTGINLFLKVDFNNDKKKFSVFLVYSNIRRLRLGWGEGRLWGRVWTSHRFILFAWEKLFHSISSGALDQSCTKCKPQGIQQEEPGILVTYINFWRRILKKTTRIYIHDSVRTK